MISIVLFDQIMCQLMRNHNPPVRSYFSSAFCLHLPLMQLRKEPKVAEYTSVGVECDSASGLVKENMDCFSR